jgi:hypothetical protein
MVFFYSVVSIKRAGGNERSGGSRIFSFITLKISTGGAKNIL